MNMIISKILEYNFKQNLLSIQEWNFDFREVNISYDLFAKDFLKEKGHRTVPQLYWNDTHVNKLPTTELTYENVCAELDYESYIGGVENWGTAQRA